MTVNAAHYLARVAMSRALYRELVADALSMHPPRGARSPESRPLESHVTLATLVDRLKASRSTVVQDVKRLELFRWVERGTPRVLGAVEGDRIHLLADVEAEQATGMLLLVSREVLGPELLGEALPMPSLPPPSTPPLPAPDSASRRVELGPRRRFNPNRA